MISITAVPSDPVAPSPNRAALGAKVAAGLADRFRPDFRIVLRSFVATILGRLMLGYGAPFAFDCNIGVIFFGVASERVHS